MTARVMARRLHLLLMVYPYACRAGERLESHTSIRVKRC